MGASRRWRGWPSAWTAKGEPLIVGSDGQSVSGSRPSSYYDRIVDVMEELVRFTILIRPHAAQLVDRYSERKDKGIVTQTESHITAALSRG